MAIFVLGVLFQVYLAGVGVFGINARKVASASSLNPHRAWGSVLMIVSVILLILALAAWRSARTVLGSFVLAARAARRAATSGWAARALDGMVILLLSLGLAVAAWRRRGAARSLAGHAGKNLHHGA